MVGVEKGHQPALYTKSVTLDRDEGLRGRHRPSRRSRRSSREQPGGTVAAGNASQFGRRRRSVRMSAAEAARVGRTSRRSASIAVSRGRRPREPDGVGIGRCLAIPKLLQLRRASTVDDIDLWELNEAFAVQVLYCRDKLGIRPTG